MGDIRPINIEITSTGEIKVAPYKITPSEDSNYYKSKNQKIPTYLAPELLENLSKNIKDH